MLSKAQSNQLAQILTENSLSPALFKKIEAELSFKIDLLDSLYHFYIYKVSVGLTLSIVPVISNPLPMNDWFRWDDVVRCFSSWAKTIAEDNAAPDLWAEAALQIEASASDDTPFTLSEAKKLQEQLTKLQAEVSTLALTPAEQTVVQKVLADEQKVLSSLPDKKSWMKAFGTKLSDGLATTLTKPETLAAVAQWIYKALVAAVPTLAAAAAAQHFLH